MLLGALWDLSTQPKSLQQCFASLGIDDLHFDFRRVQIQGETAVQVGSLPTAKSPPFRTAGEMLAIIEASHASLRAKARAARIINILAQGEGQVHGELPAQVHFHEIGQLDTILDVLGIAVLLDDLGEPELTCGALPSGHGQVKTEHGPLDCPVPVVKVIAHKYQIPFEPVDINGETITPTGIAVVAEAVKSFGATPPGTFIKRGVGAGSREFTNFPNIVRAYLYGES